MPPQTLLLIRHGQSVWNAAGKWQGQADPKLSQQGLDQSIELATVPLLDDIDHLVSSDLQRAVETARPIGIAHGLALVEDAGLRELDVGSWSGLTRDEIEEADAGAIDRYWSGTAGWTGGETMELHADRCRATAADLAQLPHERVAVVTHGATLRMLVVALLGLDDDARRLFGGPAHASVTQLRRRQDAWQLVTYGAGAHTAPYE